MSRPQRPKASWRWLQLAVTACVAVLVVFVENRFMPEHVWLVVAVWNVTPLLLALGAVAVARSSHGSLEVRVFGTVFWVTQVILVTYFHAAWLFDLEQIATRSSTAGLIFFDIPLYSVVGGFLIAGVSMAAVAVFARTAA